MSFIEARTRAADWWYKLQVRAQSASIDRFRYAARFAVSRFRYGDLRLVSTSAIST